MILIKCEEFDCGIYENEKEFIQNFYRNFSEEKQRELLEDFYSNRTENKDGYLWTEKLTVPNEPLTFKIVVAK